MTQATIVDDPFAEAADPFATDVASDHQADPFTTSPDEVDVASAGEAMSPLDIAANAVAEALETTAFLSAEPGDLLVEPDRVRRVRLAFGGPSAGTLIVDAEPMIGRLLVAGALGIDPSDPEADGGANDALCEIVNVAAGAMMPQLVARSGGNAEEMPADACPLGLPTVAEVDGSAWDDVGPCEAVRLDVEGHPMLVRLESAA